MLKYYVKYKTKLIEGSYHGSLYDIFNIKIKYRNEGEKYKLFANTTYVNIGWDEFCSYTKNEYIEGLRMLVEDDSIMIKKISEAVKKHIQLDTRFLNKGWKEIQIELE